MLLDGLRVLDGLSCVLLLVDCGFCSLSVSNFYCLAVCIFVYWPVYCCMARCCSLALSKGVGWPVVILLFYRVYCSWLTVFIFVGWLCVLYVGSVNCCWLAACNDVCWLCVLLLGGHVYVCCLKLFIVVGCLVYGFWLAVCFLFVCRDYCCWLSV